MRNGMGARGVCQRHTTAPNHTNPQEDVAYFQHATIKNLSFAPSNHSSLVRNAQTYSLFRPHGLGENRDVARYVST